MFQFEVKVDGITYFATFHRQTVRCLIRHPCTRCGRVTRRWEGRATILCVVSTDGHAHLTEHRAICAPGDKFNVDIGRRQALDGALRKHYLPAPIPSGKPGLSLPMRFGRAARCAFVQRYEEVTTPRTKAREEASRG